MELPHDPRPELWAEGEPVLPVVFDGAYLAMGDEEPAFDYPTTQNYREILRRARLFSAVREPQQAGIRGLCRVRVDRLFREDDHTAANMAKAATVPGLLGYRFELTATIRLRLECPHGESATYEARSVLKHIYHHSDVRSQAREHVYRAADRANLEAILHQLRADPDLFRSPTPL